MTKTEKYLQTLEEAVNLFEAIDFPPSRIRAILNKIFKDYFDKKIDEEILVEVGSILHHLQQGTWDYDPDIMSVTCSLDDQTYKEHRLPTKQEREKLYKYCYEMIFENQTVSVSIPKELTEEETIIHTKIKEAVKRYSKNE